MPPPDSTLTNANGKDYVDLGLSVYWATENINNNEFFKWGSTVGTPYADSSSNFNKDHFNNQVAYAQTGVLPLEYDAAHIYMGGDWRMPNSEEIYELETSCKKEVKTINNIKYTVFTSNINNEELLLPYIGFVNNGGLLYSAWNSCFWGSINFGGNYTAQIYNGNMYLGNTRDYGYNIRGVLQKQKDLNLPKLQVPVTTVSGRTVTWKAVDNTGSYEVVYINGETTTWYYSITTGLTATIDKAPDSALRVRALPADPSKFLKSDWSE